MARWIFVRHGESEANAEGWMSGHTDVGLTERGRDQAVALQPALARERIRLVVSSDLTRARHTARLVMGSRAHGILALPGLRERALGAWNRRSWASFDRPTWSSVFHTWEGRPPHGESLRDIALRAVPALAALPEHDTVLVVSHGGTMRALLGLLDGHAEAEIPTRHVDNATPFVRQVSSGDWTAALERLSVAKPR